MRRFDENTYYRPADEAMRLIGTVATLAQWRHYCKGPPFAALTAVVQTMMAEDYGTLSQEQTWAKFERLAADGSPPAIAISNELSPEAIERAQERIASEEPTSAPVMMSASPAGGWASTRSPNPLSHHRSSLVSAPVASISVLPSHGIPRSGAVGRHAHERRGRVLRHSARSSIAAHPRQTASWMRDWTPCS